MRSFKDRWEKLENEWGNFLQVIINPFVIILVVVTFIFGVALINQKDPVIIAEFTLLVGIFSGVLGGLLTKRWEDLTDEKVIEVRAKSATRSLNSLLNKVISVENRVRLYIDRSGNVVNEPDLVVNKEVIHTYLEEIAENFIRFEGDIINSIEDWKDILPSVDISTVVNRLTELNMKYAEEKSKVDQVNAKLSESTARSEEEIANLKEEKERSDIELARIKDEMRKNSEEVGIPGLYGSAISGSAVSPTFPSTSSYALNILQQREMWLKATKDFRRLIENSGIQVLDIPQAEEDKKE